MSGRVIVVGSVNVDLVVRGERLPEPGETVIGGTFARFHGGKGGNKAVAAARLGASVALVAALGEDDFGDDAAAALEAQGVGTGAVVRLADTPTGVALILVDAAGENLIAVAPGANAALTVDHVRAALSAPRAAAGRRGHRQPRDPDGDGSRGAPAGSRGRRADGVQPGTGGRPRPLDPRAGRRPDAQPRRARDPGRRSARRSGRTRPAPRIP